MEVQKDLQADKILELLFDEPFHVMHHYSVQNNPVHLNIVHSACQIHIYNREDKYQSNRRAFEAFREAHIRWYYIQQEDVNHGLWHQ